MANPTIDFSGLTLLESAVAQLQQQTLTAGGETIGAMYSLANRAGQGGGSQSATYTVSQLIQRVQAILLTLQSLPQ